MFKKILLPVDGSETSKSIIPYCTNLAQKNDGHITLFSVKTGDASTQQLVDSTLNELLDSGLRADSIRVKGAAADQIVFYAENNNYDLIAMSTQGRNGMKRAVIGSVTEEVIRTTSLPVLTVNGSKNNSEGSIKIGKIIVPLDGSALSESALPFAISLVSSIPSNLLITNVISATKVIAGDPILDGLITFDETSHTVKAKKSDSAQYLSETTKRLSDDLPTIESKVMDGEPSQAIMSLAKQHTDPLVILASHGRAGLNRLVMGSVTETLMRTSNFPILVIPETPE
ncbi:MAG: universal stress protein [Dehalococcoidia bacterium]|tara:strand:- start:2135 stop:2989 length:855 start_codon:yes stop_codon:yes gene_type:complete